MHSPSPHGYHPSRNPLQTGLALPLSPSALLIHLLRPPEDPPRITRRQRIRRHNNYNALQPNIKPLVMYQRPTIPIAQLINTISTPYQYQQDTCTQKREEDLETLIQRLLLRICALSIANSVFNSQRDKDAQRDDLEAEARNGDVDGDFRAAGRYGGERAAAALEDEAEDVAGDEEPVVELGGEACVGGAEVDDYLGEGEVDGCGEEGWSECDTACICY